MQQEGEKDEVDFGRALKKLIVDLGWRQQTLVDKTGIRQPKLSKIMNGKELATGEELEALMAIPEVKAHFDQQGAAVLHQPKVTTDISQHLQSRVRSSYIETISISNSRLTCGAWTAGENEVVTGGFDGELCRVNLKDRKPHSYKLTNSILRSLCVVGSDGLVITADDAGCIYAVHMGGTEAQLVGKTGSPVYACAMSRNNQRLVTAERNGDVTEWNFVKAGGSKTAVRHIEKLRIVHTHEGAAFDVAYNSDVGTYWSVGADGCLRTSLQNSRKNANLKVCSGTLFSLSVGRTGKLVTCSSAAGDIFVILESQPNTLRGHTDAVRSLHLSPRNRWLLSGSKDGTVRLWNLESHNAWILLNARDYVYTVKFSLDGRCALVTEGAGTLYILSLPVPIDDLEETGLDFLLTKN